MEELLRTRREQEEECAAILKKNRDSIFEHNQQVKINEEREKRNPYIDTDIKVHLTPAHEDIMDEWHEESGHNKSMIEENKFKCELCDNLVETMTQLRYNKGGPNNDSPCWLGHKNGCITKYGKYLVLMRRKLCNDCD